ncbi:MAG: trypsin-like peptidase domain-containing protein [Conexivisphaerales archaeon]
MANQVPQNRRIFIAALVIIGIVAGAAAGTALGFALASNTYTKQPSSIQQQLLALQGEVNLLKAQLSSLNQTGAASYTVPSNLTTIYNRVKSSVVVIEGIISQSVLTFFGPTTQYELVQGSGFVYSYNGSDYIITNNHVVDGASNITVIFYDGSSGFARVVGTDPYSDLAVLSVKVPSSIAPLNVVPSRYVQVGQPVVAVGSPFGLAGSMTFGIISQVGRTITESTAGNYAIADVLQFSAPINPGNSGGPLLDTNGDVIGITTATVSNSQGLGFAIPSDTILRELPSLVATGSYNSHPYLGIQGTDMTPYIASAAGVNITYGWLVESVVAGGPAANAGIRGGSKQIQTVEGQITVGGDLIIAINGTRIVNGDALSSYLEENTLPGQTVALTIVRGNQTLVIDVVLGTRPPPS